MQKQVKVSILAGVLFAGAIDVGAQPLTVVVRDYAGINLPVLGRAEIEAARILGTAGAEVTWVNCRDSIEPSQPCRRPRGSMELELNLLSAGVTRYSTQPGAMGFALLPKSGSFGSFAGVLYDRVEQLSFGIARKPVVLGHAMAHEIGHLLLGADGHAPSGIMKSEWHSKELQKAAQGLLVFRDEERRQVQENVQRRMADAATNNPGE